MKTHRHRYLIKANDDLISHCKCADAMITFPPQLDCPWCGCGWLFSCISCRKAFTFARGVLVNEPWGETARRDLKGFSKKEPSREDVRQWVGAMQELLADVKLGQEYVCLDGQIIPRTATTVCFEGWHSRHDLDSVPQVAALTDHSVVDDVLANPEYWRSTALHRE